MSLSNTSQNLQEPGSTPVPRMTLEQVQDCQPEEGGTGTRFLSCKKEFLFKGMFSFEALIMKNFFKSKKQMFFVVSSRLLS